MATLRDLRTKAKELGIAYEKTTTAAELEEMIAAKMCSTEKAAPASDPVAEMEALLTEKMSTPDAEAAAEAAAELAASPPVTGKVSRSPITVPPPEVVPAENPASEIPATPSPIAAPPVSPEPTSMIPAPEAASETESVSSAKAGFSAEVIINEYDLNTEFKNQAAKFAIFAEQEAMIKAKVMTAKLRVEVVNAELTKSIRERLTASGIKPTEKMIESEVILSKEYQAAQHALISATRDAEVARAAKEAFMQRKDMLIQLGSAKRMEAEHLGMSIKERMKEVIGKAA